MTEKLRRVAQEDTPQSIRIPEGFAGLIIWAAGKWGLGVLVGAACFWGMTRIYDDQKQDRIALVDILRSEVTAKVQLTMTLTELRAAIDEIRKNAEIGHRNLQNP